MIHLINILLSRDCLSSTALVINFVLNSVTEKESCQFIIISCVLDDIYLFVRKIYICYLPAGRSV